MDDITEELNELFASSAPDGLPQDVLTELQSMLRLHGITPQELFYKWESYSMKMGADDTSLDLNTVRAFKRDVQDSLERGSRDKSHQVRGTEKRSGVSATPRAGNTDVFGMYVCRSGCRAIRVFQLLIYWGSTGLTT
jgi:DNA polymerase alpha subunit B